MTHLRPLVVLVAALFSIPAQAKHTATHNIDAAAIAPYPFHHIHYRLRQTVHRHAERHRTGYHSRRVVLASREPSYGEGVIGGRPAGCPHAYCGCGLRKFLGFSDVRLNLAWNWALLFPREYTPRVGLAAVRHHHVMYLEARRGGSFLIRDYNSGAGMSRLHVRDLRGYIFVDPSRGKLALR